MNALADPRDSWRQDFLAARTTLPGADVPWLARRRAAAMERFLDTGFPSARDENWKYTDVRPVVRQHLPPATAGAALEPAALTPFWRAAHVLVFVDGHYRAGLSTPPAGVQVASLAEVLERDVSAIEPWFATGKSSAPHAFAMLNEAFLRDGALVRFGAGVVVAEPLQLLFVTTGMQPATAYLRNLVVAQPGSQATLIESYAALGDGSGLTNTITEIDVESGAALEHYRMENEAGTAYHYGGTRVRLGQNAHYTGHDILRGARLARHEIDAALNDEGGSCVLNGLYLGHHRQHLDVQARIDHRTPAGTSRNTYKGVLDDQARGVFSGRTVVHTGAQRTDARQSNHNLLLSAAAEADSRPQFEIYADDVKCTHGSSVGSLDPEALFYLRSRALDETAARRLLVVAFVSDVLAAMRLAPLRDRLERELAGTLLAGPTAPELTS